MEKKRVVIALGHRPWGIPFPNRRKQQKERQNGSHS